MAEEVHKFRNNDSAVRVGDIGWQAAYEGRLLEIRVRTLPGDLVEDQYHRQFINMCSCSYLGLHNHPKILAGAISALEREQMLGVSMSRLRVQPAILEELEQGLSDLFRCRSLVTHSCSAATTGVLPLLASGHLADDRQRRVMVFDRHCHFSMNLIKPICADESTVLDAPHNDLDFVEDACKKHQRVCYVADGTYSMGGATMLEGLIELQDRYGLFLFLDDSHSVSICGERGEGYVRSRVSDELSPLTIIVASLAKGFGAGGGVIMLGGSGHEQTLLRYGGPMTWSQGPNVPTLGACLASLELHRSPELALLQRQLHENVAIFDREIETSGRGDGLHIRKVSVGAEETAVRCSEQMMERGFYTSAVFFPIVERGKAGLRVMLRADNRPADVLRFCEAVREVVQFD
ncbi:MAG: aminotransferase class I/II-fold pyridoxal phosphate-dependent enzyme [Acidobacteriota bacterium]|nr:aminotransferase class I/II-fold pyridoxal phosphate-dependent enzyme [Acidobacteriota bacterium]